MDAEVEMRPSREQTVVHYPVSRQTRCLAHHLSAAAQSRSCVDRDLNREFALMPSSVCGVYVLFGEILVNDRQSVLIAKRLGREHATVHAGIGRSALGARRGARP